MSDKANTKHGNMVALGPFTANADAPSLSDNLTRYAIRYGESASDYAWKHVTLPFSGHIVALSSSGDYAYAGTWSVAAAINDTVLDRTRLQITADPCSVTMNSAQSVAFAAGDSLGVAITTSGDFANNDGGYSIVYVFVVFDNA